MPNNPPHILIVDDDAEILAILMRILGRDGYSVSGTTSGRAAMAMAERQAYDLILLDLSMPEPDGFEVLKTVHSQNPKQRIIVISGVMQGVLLKASELFGAIAALAKPLSPELLLKTVATTLGTPPRR